MTAPMVDPLDPRQVFKAEVLAHVQDLGRMCKYVVTRRALPIPAPDVFTAGLYTTVVKSSDEFERCAAILAADGPVERSSNDYHRLVRKEFGSVSLEVWLSQPLDGPDTGQEAAADAIAEDDALELERGLRDDG